MRKAQLMICYLWVIAILFAPSVSSAETYQQKDNLFKMTVPNGWQWIEKSGSISVINPSGDNGIAIQYEQRSGYSAESAKQALKINSQRMTKIIKADYKGNIVGETEIQVDGIYTRRINFTMTRANKTNNATYIVFIHKNCVFTITYGSSDSIEKLIMDKAIESLKFIRN